MKDVYVNWAPEQLHNCQPTNLDENNQRRLCEMTRLQAQLARAQAEAIRQQTFPANQRRFLAAVTVASDDELHSSQ